jgi:hypothetical protein
MAQGLLSTSCMNEQVHRMRSKRPLYLVVMIAAVASMATTYIGWDVQYVFEGPRVTLLPDVREEVVPFTIRFSPRYDGADIRVTGSALHEAAGEELRFSLVEPDERTLATQFQQVEGDGRVEIQLSTWDTKLHCAPGETEVCEQELAVVFGTGGASTGGYVIDWELEVSMRGHGEEPADLVFEVDFPRGRLIYASPREGELLAPGPAPGE